MGTTEGGHRGSLAGALRARAGRQARRLQRSQAFRWTREAVLHTLGRPSFDPFPTLPRSPEKRARNLAKAPAERGYAIVFTPRSGSSRLGEILTSAGGLSKPAEYFNPSFVPKVAASWGAESLEDYVAILRRLRNDGGTFGFEATWRHIELCFGSADRFRAAAAPDAWLWLIREDIVAQAVSVSRMVQTKVAHNVPAVGADRLAEADARFEYSAEDIGKRVRAMRDMEKGSEAMFARFGVRPLRLSYERVTPMAPAEAAALVARHVGVALPPGARFESGHSKLGTDKNLEFAERFRAEHPDLLRRIDRERAPMLAALDKAPG